MCIKEEQHRHLINQNGLVYIYYAFGSGCCKQAIALRVGNRWKHEHDASLVVGVTVGNHYRGLWTMFAFKRREKLS